MDVNNKKLIQEKIRNLREEPGCYLWKNSSGEVIYVGKAARLQYRVRSYLNPNVADMKTRLLQEEIAGLDWIVTASETDALVLEATLIKKYSPKYNVRLKDDKRYPFICVSTSENFPRVYLTRNTRNTKDRFYGPFIDSRATRNLVHTIHKIFPVRKRNIRITAKKQEPCLNYHMKRCLAPCAGLVTKEHYGEIIRQILAFLDGKKDILVGELKNKMEDHSARMEFEAAARYRDMISAVVMQREKQTVVSEGDADEDIIAFARRGDDGQVILLEVREGRLENKKSFPLRGVENSGEEEILSSFIRDYYVDTGFIPRTVYLPGKMEKELKLVRNYFSEKFGVIPKFKMPAGGDKLSLLKVARKNAEMGLAERIMATKLQDKTDALNELQELLHLPEIPEVIECYDISHFQGSFPVASGVMFVDGKPYKSGYRHYNMRGYEGINDPGMIHEVIARRLQRLLNEGEELPDLIVIDGGITQLNKACEAAVEAGVPELPIVSLAKKREEIWFPGKNLPVLTDKNRPALKLLRHIRDEAHRFGVSHHRKRRNKSAVDSVLKKIPDLGEKRAKLLLQNLEGRDLADMQIEELLKIPGIGKKTAEKIAGFIKHDSGEK